MPGERLAGAQKGSAGKIVKASESAVSKPLICLKSIIFFGQQLGPFHPFDYVRFPSMRKNGVTPSKIDSFGVVISIHPARRISYSNSSRRKLFPGSIYINNSNLRFRAFLIDYATNHFIFPREGKKPGIKRSL